MKYSFQIIQSYPRQSVPSIVLNSETRKYFFNAPETFQRLSSEHFVRSKKGSRIFLTQINTNHISGVFGLLLTLFESKLAFDVQLFGPPGFTNYIDSIRFLFGLRILPYSVYDFSNSNTKLLGIKLPSYMDKVLCLPEYNKLYWEMNGYLETRQKESPGDINDAEQSIQNGYYKDESIEIHPVILRSSSSEKVSVSYVCIANRIPGKIDVAKVKALNVPKKFIFNIVQKKELFVKGVLYKAADFQEPEEPAPVMIIVDCPEVASIDSLVNNSSINKYISEGYDSNQQVLHAIVHILPDEVLLNEKYAEFLKKLPQNCHHIFVNENLKEKAELLSSQGKVTEIDGNLLKYRHFSFTNLLAKFFPEHFPSLEDIKTTGKYDLDKIFPYLKYTSTNQKLVEYIMSPAKHSGFAKVNVSFEKSIGQRKHGEEEQAVLAKRYQKMIEEQRIRTDQDEKEANRNALKLFKNCDPEMVFLGTGSMRPDIYRNVSGIYLRFWQQKEIGVLLDCGEGTYFQLLNHYGYEKTRELLKNLSVIFITHIHADHNLGLMKILSERKRILKEDKIKKDPIYVVIPYNCSTWLLNYSAVEQLDYRIVYNQHINIDGNEADISKLKSANGTTNAPKQFSPKKTSKPQITGAGGEDEYEYYDDPRQNKNVLDHFEEAAHNVKGFQKFLLEKLGIVNFKTINVNHCPQACAVMIEHKDGWKYVYSGDTRPCQRLIDKAGPVTILVHESTFASEMQKFAESKMHSTEKEAIGVGMKMNAWRTVLTHFSQRYANVATGASKKAKDENKSVSSEDKLYSNYSTRNTVRVIDHFRMKFSQLTDLPAKSNCILGIIPRE